MADSPIVERLLELSRENKLNSASDLIDLSKKVEREPNYDDVVLGRLDWSPAVNWVEKFGGLPKYIEEVAIGIMKSGKTREQAIPIAISRIKVWATGKGVKPDTQAKAIAALAQWEKLKAKAAAARRKK